jgi:cytochrome c-type biogenesis protein
VIEVSYISALIGGILTFLAPCTLPLIPAYLGFLAGAPKEDESGALKQQRILINAFLFTLAFTVVFMFFGLVSGAVGAFFELHRAFIARLGGVLVIIFGLSMLGVFEIPQLFSGRKMPKVLTPGKPFSSFLLGLLFALGWSPCLGPILGTILALAASTSHTTAMSGALLLFVYSLGLAIPFLVIALLYGTSYRYVTALGRMLPFFNKVGGALFVVIGVLLLLGDFGLLNVWVEEVFGRSWYNTLMDHM